MLPWQDRLIWISGDAGNGRQAVNHRPVYLW